MEPNPRIKGHLRHIGVGHDWNRFRFTPLALQSEPIIIGDIKEYDSGSDLGAFALIGIATVQPDLCVDLEIESTAPTAVFLAVTPAFASDHQVISEMPTAIPGVMIIEPGPMNHHPTYHFCGTIAASHA